MSQRTATAQALPGWLPAGEWPLPSRFLRAGPHTIFGEKNDPFGFQRRWKNLFPHAIQQVVPKGHHFPMNDDPGLFARAVRDFASGTVPHSAARG